MKSRLFLFWILVLTIGCAGPKYFIAPGFTGDKLTQGGLIILPVLAGETGAGVLGIEGYRRSCGEGLAASLRQDHPTLKVIGPSETSSIIAKQGLVDKYSGLIENYKKTGVFDIKIAAQLATAIGSKYLMLPKIQNLYSPDANHAIANLSSQIWDSEGSEMVFETTGKGEDISFFGVPNYGKAIEAATKMLSKNLGVLYKAK